MIFNNSISLVVPMVAMLIHLISVPFLLSVLRLLRT